MKGKVPTCPFCGRPIEKPRYLAIGFSDLEAGVCECGSVYVCDVTGHNRGTAFVEALVIACAGDWDLAWDLIPDEDYKEIWVENYDLETHQILPVPPYGRRKLSSALCFIKLADDIRELKESKLKDMISPKKVDVSLPKVEKRKLNKKELEKLIASGEKELVTAYAVAEPLNLNVFQKLLYHPDPVFRKKVVITLGDVVEKVVKFHPQKVLELIKRLIYAAADSAASPWGALEAVGEIIARTGDRYSVFLRNLFAFLPLPEYRVYLLYAFLRIATLNPEVLKQSSYLSLVKLIKDEDPQIKGLAIMVLKLLNPGILKENLNDVDPEEKFKFFDYELGEFKEITLGSLLKDLIH